MRRCAVVMTAALALFPAAAAAQQVAATPDPRIERLIASVSQARLERLLRSLVGFGTRNTLSDTSSPTRGIGAARQWIFDELTRTSPKLQVSFDTHRIKKGAGNGRITRNVELRNVVAVLPGRSPRRIYVSGHYDSLSLLPEGQLALNRGTTAPPDRTRDPNVDAPGANDDGSGTVLVMELARVFAESGIDFDATIVFIAVAGEEQGLLGARAHARRARETQLPVQAVFNNDIVGGGIGGDGTTDAATIRLYSEGPDDSPSRALAAFTERTAQAYLPQQRWYSGTDEPATVEVVHAELLREDWPLLARLLVEADDPQLDTIAPPVAVTVQRVAEAALRGASAHSPPAPYRASRRSISARAATNSSRRPRRSPR